MTLLLLQFISNMLVSLYSNWLPDIYWWRIPVFQVKPWHQCDSYYRESKLVGIPSDTAGTYLFSPTMLFRAKLRVHVPQWCPAPHHQGYQQLSQYIEVKRIRYSWGSKLEVYLGYATVLKSGGVPRDACLVGISKNSIMSPHFEISIFVLEI